MRKQALGSLLFAAALCACAPLDPVLEDADVTCGSGKCDGWEKIKKDWRAITDADIADLLAVGAGLATQEINDALGTQEFSLIKMFEPQLFVTPERAAEDLTLGNLEELVSGLAARYGETELVTQVNRLRSDYLAQNPSSVWGESGFQLGPVLNMNWNIAAGGLGGASLSLGFEGGSTKEVRVVAAYDGELRGTLKSPLRALKALRGFVLPKDLADIRRMRAGELVAMRGVGRLGANFGVGVPLLVAEPTAGLTYSVALTAGYRTSLSGSLDIQLIRLAGDEFVIDVGMDRAKLTKHGIAITDGWGLKGVLKSEISIGSVKLDPARLVERALESALDRNISLVNASYDREKLSGRQTMARFRFSLDQVRSEAKIAEAVAQTMKGDIRLAQALAAMHEPGIIAELDISRFGTSVVRHAGVGLFGLEFYWKEAKTQGGFVVQTPGGARSLLFNSLEQEDGGGFLWLSEWNNVYRRIGLSGLIWEAGRNPRQEANLWMQLRQSDKGMRRDQLLDHLDGILSAVGGPEALRAIERHGNLLERYVASHCRGIGDDPNDEECMRRLVGLEGELGDDGRYAQSLRDRGMRALEEAIPALKGDQRALVLRAGAARLAAQLRFNSENVNTRLNLDYRLDDGALANLMEQHVGFDLRLSALNYLQAAEVSRQDEDLLQQRARLERDNRADLDRFRDYFDESSRKYRKLLLAEGAIIDTIGPIGGRALEIAYTVDAQKRVDYEHATARSFAEARSQTVTSMVDKIQDRADHFDTRTEQVLTYALMGLTPPRHLDVRFSVGFKRLDERTRAAGYADFSQSAVGDKVKPIDAGVFNIDSIINFR